jgi:hypothetical protein
MAMILDFRSRSDARPEQQNASQSESQGTASEPRHRVEPIGAQIIIFPGVRRERHAEAPKPPRRKSRPKRDRLELPD